MATLPQSLLQHIRRLVAPDMAGGESDAALLGRFVAGRDEGAFAALVARHGPLVFGVCRRGLRDHQAAEDACQATFLVLARKAAAVRPPERLASWLHGVARNVVRQAQRACERRRRREHSVAAAARARDPLDELTARELLLAVDEEVQRLPQAYRLPILLCCLEDKSLEEAAAQLGWTTGSVKGRLERARARLHRRLLRRGLTLGAVLAAVEAARCPALAAPAARLTEAALGYAGGVSAGASVQALEWARAVLRRAALGKLAGLALAVALIVAGAACFAPGDEDAALGAAQLPPAHLDRDGERLPAGALARLGTARLRGIRGALTLTPDGKLLATASGPSSSRITFWDPATGHAVRHLETPATITRLAFTPDGRRVACFGNSSRTPVLDALTGQDLFTANGSHGMLSADGTMLVTGDTFGDAPQVHLWDTAAGQRLGQWPLAKGLMELALAADGRTLALIDEAEAAVVQLRDVRTGDRGRSFLIDAGPCWLAFSPDSKTLVIAQRNGVTLREVASGKLLHVWSEMAECRPVFSRDGSALAWMGRGPFGAYCPLIVRPGAAAPAPLAAPQPSARPASFAIETPCFTPDGKTLAVLTEAGALQFRDVGSGQETIEIEAHANGVFGIALTPDGKHVVSRDGLELLVWDAASGRLVRRIPARLSEHELLTDLLPDGRLLTEDRTADPRNGLFRVRAPLTGSELLRFEGRPDVGPPHAVVAPGGRYAALRGRAGEACVIDLRDYHCLYRHKPGAAGFGMFLSSDGDVLASHTRLPGGEMQVRQHGLDDVVRVPLPKDSQLERWLSNQRGVSPDCRWLVAPGDDGRLHRWDLRAGKELAPLPDAQPSVWSLFWSPDSRLVAAHGSHGARYRIERAARQQTMVWDVASGRRLPHLDLPDGESWQGFARDGRTVFTTSATAVTIWEVATGKQRHRLPVSANVVVVSDDGRTLVTGSSDTQVLIWDLTGAPAHPPSAQELDAAWTALAEDDAQAAYAALWQLVAAPDAALRLLQEHLRPVAIRLDPDRLKRLITEMESEDFAKRQRASSELEGFGELAVPTLRDARQGSLSLEGQRRVDALIVKLDPHRLAGQPLRAVRSVEVLERLATPGARRLLETLAAGTAEARLTREATAAVQRLALGDQRRNRDSTAP